MIPGKYVSVQKAMADHEADKAAKADGEIIWSMFRCADLYCNKLLTVEDHTQGQCGGCQGIKFIIARYLTKKEARLIKQGKINPHKVNLDVIGLEPPIEGEQ